MRIIDNKYDFYDYLQDPTDQLVFDRRGSYNLTKEILCHKIKLYSYGCRVSSTENNYRMLIQCGAAFWLVLLKMNNTMDNYDLELLDFWKNYDKPNELLKIDLIVFGWRINRAKVEDMRDAINHGNRLIMMNNGKVVFDVKGEEKKNLTVEILLEKFTQSYSQDMLSDRLVLG